jgi:hypothetical protein
MSTDTISYGEALERVGRALYGKDWIGRLSHRERWLLDASPIKPAKGSILPGHFIVNTDIQLTPELSAELGAAKDRQRRMQAQYGLVKQWLERRGWRSRRPISKAQFERAVAAIQSATTRANEFKNPSDQRVKTAIKAVYDSAELEGRRPPNVKELANEVLAILDTYGYRTSARNIQRIGEAPEFKKRRWLPGKRKPKSRSKRFAKKKSPR